MSCCPIYQPRPKAMSNQLIPLYGQIQQNQQQYYPAAGMNQGKYAMPSSQIPYDLPTGIPTGPTVAPMPLPFPGVQIQSPTEDGDAIPQTVLNTDYTQGFLKTQIGKKVRVEFLMGTNGPLIDRTGTLIDVGVSYILIRPDNSDDVLMADMYSIKFVTILY